MKVHALSLGPVQTNCYIIENEETLLVIDPGAEFEKINSLIQNLNKQVEAVLLTHTHFDHIGAVEDLVDAFQVKVYVAEEEKYWLSDPESNGSEKFKSYGLEEIVVRVKPEILRPGQKTLGSFKFDVMHTPGHSPGSLTFVFEDFAVVGDTLFKEGIGRTDLKEGNLQTLMNSIDELMSLPEDTVIYPGHGPKTTLAYESDHNPFL
ncbi:MBL fold metallo-hydrolase [Macrococcus brunensis]|uniref:MBL fold metallo-hydrolase n=1 Tax=Macrococcus brunensis TaxID=198483 RepID=UPI001EF13ADF|nr:MBL fold metallo-hydrolase [Macrococcus brunensis]ULG71095.1 MBL fold metallo-hydrolase [Macrococcus brunensis]ULG73431.1 MBL fold metallo-hydrolase [Macrococcus brunensis]